VNVTAASRSVTGPFVPPRLTARVRPAPPDDGSRRLTIFAAGLIRSAPAVLQGVLSATHDSVNLSGYVDDPDVEDRAWVCRDRDEEVFCILDTDGERSLLGFVVGSAPAGRLSALERRIVGDVMVRLVQRSCDGQSPVHEELRKRPAGQTWCCCVELSGGKNAAAHIRLFRPRALPPEVPNLRPAASRIPVGLRALAPVAPACLAAVNAWRPGLTLRLAPSPQLLNAVLYVAGQRIARAHAGAVAERRAVRITDLHVPASPMAVP
jgi:hypothetical protein